MIPIVKFNRLPLPERWLLLKTAGLLVTIRLALRLLPFPVVRALLKRVSHPCRRLTTNPPPATRLAWAVATISRFIPGAGHCLTQALVGYILLARRGYVSTVCFGVVREPEADFMAHAWVEHNGVVVIGGDHTDRYVRLVSPADSPSEWV